MDENLSIQKSVRLQIDLTDMQGPLFQSSNWFGGKGLEHPLTLKMLTNK